MRRSYKPRLNYLDLQLVYVLESNLLHQLIRACVVYTGSTTQICGTVTRSANNDCGWRMEL